MRMRTILQSLVLVQWLAAGAIAGYLWRSGVGLAPAIAIGLAVPLAVRIVINLNNFVLAARFASPTPREFALSLPARARLLAEEFAASMLASSWHMVHARPAQTIYPGQATPPVLLLHGYGCNSGYWVHLIRRLDAARISHASLDLEPIAGDIDGYAPMVGKAIDALCAASGQRQAIIVAHSMGGLVARAYLRACGDARVARVITLGTPHHGTSLAQFGPGLNAQQMRRGASGESDWLRALAAGESERTRALFVSLYTHHDNIVAPQTSSVLPGARNLAFGGIGHVAMGSNGRILDAVMGEIDALATR